LALSSCDFAIDWGPALFFEHLLPKLFNRDSAPAAESRRFIGMEIISGVVIG
jgi:hypothetical protein